MKIAMFQSDIDWCNKEQNIKVGKIKIEEAKKAGCSVIFFPEMSFTGFSMNTENTKEKNGETISVMQEIAKENKIAVGFGYVKDCTDFCENHYAVVDNEGKVISDYTKIHPFSAGYEDKNFKGGNSLTSYKIEGINFSTFICYDLRFPEIFQAVSNKAEIIAVPANWPKNRSQQWRILLRARAIETSCCVLGINCVGVHDEIYYSGNSMAVNPKGDIITERSNIQDLLITEINMDEIRLSNENINTQKDRKPQLYKTFYNTNLR